MTRNSIVLFLSLLLSLTTLGQTKTDAEKDKLFGKVKSIHSFIVHYRDKKPDTVWIGKSYFNESGMKLKYINLYKPSRMDSIIKKYDKQNRIISKIEYESISSLSSDEVEKRIDTTYYEYDSKCNNPAVVKSPTGTYQINYEFDEDCRMISETEVGRGRTNTIEVEFDQKGRVIKQTFTYLGDKPDKVETYLYNDVDNTLTYLEYSPRYDVYRGKIVTQYNKNNKEIEKRFFNAPSMGGGILFTTGSKAEPDEIKLIKKYQYNNEKLISEIHYDGKNEELIKVEIAYNEVGDLKEQKFLKEGKLEHREEYKYENGKRVEEKYFLLNKKVPESTKLRKYNSNKQQTEFVLLEGKNKYSNEYVYDNFNNEIEKRELKNGKLLNIEVTKIEYHTR